MTDDRFERELRGFLAAREPAAVSPVLRARLQAVTAEPPAGAGAFAGWLGGAWRAAVGLTAAAVIAVVLVALLTRVDGLTIRDPGQVGGPTAVPGTAIPFVTAPAQVFTAGAVADAERRLAAVLAASGLEARFVVTPVDSAAQLTAPDGWPDAFDSDGDPDRDILAVIGMTPDGTPVCCLTLMGDLIERAKAEMYWRPTDQPGALDDDLAASTAEFRDVALDRFVRGIEDLAPGLATLEGETWGNSDIQRTAGLLAVVVPLLLLAFFALRRRPDPAAVRPGWAEDGVELLEISPAAATALPASAVPTGSISPLPAASTSAEETPVVAWRGDEGGTVRRSRWPAWPAWAVRSDRDLVLVVFAAIAGMALLGVVDLLLPARTDVRLDPTIDGVGVARGGLSIVPIVLVGIALGALSMYARQGRWRRRFGVLTFAVLVGWTTSVVVGQTMPAIPATDRGWVAGEGGEVVWRGVAGLGEQVAYELDPGDAFTFATTIRNEGFLPLTILGLDGVRTTQPNPYVVSIVSIGWVVQPTDNGQVTYLSAKPGDASASWPVTLGSGDELVIVVVGRGGPCADAGGTITDLPLTHVDLAYRVMGFQRSTEVGLAAILSFPSRSPCTVQVPGGTITFSTPGQ
jgi:hypothetical protein